jgi:hypothetical protein
MSYRRYSPIGKDISYRKNSFLSDTTGTEPPFRKTTVIVKTFAYRAGNKRFQGDAFPIGKLYSYKDTTTNTNS